jgi:hypothetical protein
VNGGFVDIIPLGQDIMRGKAGCKLEVTIFYGALGISKRNELGFSAQGKWGLSHDRGNSSIQNGYEMNSTHTRLGRIMCPQGAWQEAGDDFQVALGAPSEVRSQPSEIGENVMNGDGQVHIGPVLTLLLNHILQYTEQTRATVYGKDS